MSQSAKELQSRLIAANKENDKLRCFLDVVKLTIADLDGRVKKLEGVNEAHL